MIADMLLALSAVIALCIGVATRPDRASCPRGTFVDGTRPDGWFACRVIPPLYPAEEARPYKPVPYDRWDEFEVPARIYCTGASRPIVVDHRTVGCQRP